MAGMFFARGMTAVISTEQISISSNAFFVKLANTKISLPFGSYTNNKGVVQVPFIRVSVIVALLVLIAVFFMLRYTKFGRSLYAVGGSEQSATMMGLDVKKTKLKAYVLSSFLCSIGGICYCLNTMSGNVQQALGLEMDAIASSVIGGTLLTGGVGNVIGSNLFNLLVVLGTCGVIRPFAVQLRWDYAASVGVAVVLFFMIIRDHFISRPEAIFLLVLFAAVTSSIALTESAVSTFEDELGWSRERATALIGLIMVALGSLSALGYGPLAGVTVFGMQFLDFFDFLTNSVMMPIAAIAICLLVSRVIGVQKIEEEVTLGGKPFRRKKIFNFMIQYLCPIFAAIILISSVANALGWIAM